MSQSSRLSVKVKGLLHLDRNPFDKKEPHQPYGRALTKKNLNNKVAGAAAAVGLVVAIYLPQRHQEEEEETRCCC